MTCLGVCGRLDRISASLLRNRSVDSTWTLAPSELPSAAVAGSTTSSAGAGAAAIAAAFAFARARASCPAARYAARPSRSRGPTISAPPSPRPLALAKPAGGPIFALAIGRSGPGSEGLGLESVLLAAPPLSAGPEGSTIRVSGRDAAAATRSSYVRCPCLMLPGLRAQSVCKTGSANGSPTGVCAN